MKLGLSLAVNQIRYRSGGGLTFSSSVVFDNIQTDAFKLSSGTIINVNTGLSQVGDVMFLTIEGVSTANVTGGSNGVWQKQVLTNAGGLVTTLLYRQLTAPDISTVLQITGLAPNIWYTRAVYRGVAQVKLVQTLVSSANATSLVFSAPTLTDKSSRLLVKLGQYTLNPDYGTVYTPGWQLPANWTSWMNLPRNSDILSSLYPGGNITFNTDTPQPEGNVGWLFELVGT
jgi:hypothetical protein